ncbi:MAG: hypothetical protein JXA57_16755 [Armatimonadetes bacterium]|nr:hypothetical protein [Armatimonadota bacterium]
MKTTIRWPDGKQFAFTVFDDTDGTTLENGPPIYRLLYDLGMRTTKSVWPIGGANRHGDGATTCADHVYCDWVRGLQRQGFEIALHNATWHTSTRAEIIGALDCFRECFGSYPNVQANHSRCADNLYWGPERLTGVNKLLYNILTLWKNRDLSLGSREASDSFWGDLCRSHIKYVRNFVFSDINTLRACPYMPYFDPKRPYVNSWFASSEGPSCASFCRTVSEANQERLERQGGACIMYTHFGAKDYYDHGELNPEFVRLMRLLSSRNGWFVPVSTILDHIVRERGERTISARERRGLERRWLAHKILGTRGTT